MPALIAAAVGLSDVDSVNAAASVGSASGAIESSAEGNDTDGVTEAQVQGSAGFVIAIAAVAILLSLLFIIIRFCNIGLINIKIKIFLIIVSWSVTMHF